MRKLLVLLFIIPCFALQPLTRAERSNFRETSTYQDVMEFIWQLKSSCPLMQVSFFARSWEGRPIPLVILSREGLATPYEAKAAGKRAVLINANIHAGEVEGKEASLILMRQICSGQLRQVLERLVVLMVPIFNPDGNEKMAPGNRRDNGPERAGVRYNGQGLDLNRDFIKQESPEVKGLVRLLQEWDPVLFVDMHTTDGAYHRHRLTWMCQMAPWTEQGLMDFSFKRMFPEINSLMRKQGYNPIPHGTFMDRKDPAKGWLFWATLARFGVNYVGLRNRLAILDENYSRAPFKERIFAALALLKSVLRFASRNLDEIVKVEKRADRVTASSLGGSSFAVEFENRPFFTFTLLSYVFKPVQRRGRWFLQKTDKERTYRLTLYSPVAPRRSVRLPEAGYVLLPPAKDAASLLCSNGVSVYRLLEDVELEVEEFRPEKIEASPYPYQGKHLKKAAGKYVKRRRKIPAGSFFVPINQPLGRIVAVALEPESPDGFLSWGLFDRVLLHQWSGRPWMVPVIKVDRFPPAKTCLYRR